MTIFDWYGLLNKVIIFQKKNYTSCSDCFASFIDRPDKLMTTK